MAEETIPVSDLVSMLREGISREAYLYMRSLLIHNGDMTVGEYVDSLKEMGFITGTDGVYRLKVPHIALIGVLSMESVPHHCLDPEAHGEFVKNVFSIYE
jgi:hypothetical protein